MNQISDDLISRKALIADMKSRKYIDKALCEIFETVVDEAPTAFDKEKVIEEIREIVSDCYLEYCGKYNNCLQCRSDEAVKIVEKGGIE